MSAGPIFVVGPSRSGTSMMRDILAGHPDVWIGGETHYFDDLRVRLRGHEQLPLSPEQQKSCEDYFLALLDRPYGRGGDPERRADRLTRDELRAAAARIGPGADAYFVAYCQVIADKRGKSRWGEKTPRHVFRIDDILGLWSDARVICMVRDPRAVVSSYRWWKRAKRPRRAQPVRDEAWAADDRRAQKSYNVFVISMLWRAAMRASLNASEKYGSERVRLQRYEDVVRDPEQELRLLTEWLGLDYDQALLDVAVSNSSFFVPGDRGISTEPLERWRANLPPGEISVIQTCCGSLMRALGYPQVETTASPLSVAWAWVTVPLALARALFVNRHRLGNPFDYVARRTRLAASRASASGPG
jgi:Sulfotransferase family